MSGPRLHERERPDHTLQTTALLDEAYLRLAGPNQSKLAEPGPFLRVAAQRDAPNPGQSRQEQSRAKARRRRGMDRIG